MSNQEPNPAPGGRRVLENPISLQQMEDGIVSPAVYSNYCNMIIHFINWCAEKDTESASPLFLTEPLSKFAKEGFATPLLTDFATEIVNSTQIVHEGDGIKKHQARVKKVFMECLRNAKTNHLIVEENVTAELTMFYVAHGANQRTGLPLKETSYGGMKSAICHLFRCQNGLGTSALYDQRMTVIGRGFGKVGARRRNHVPIGNANNDMIAADDQESDGSSVDNEDDRDEFKEGKEPMSVGLYRAVLKWLIEYATTDSLLAACFICFTWNLACRGNNTAKLKLSHISWTKFDSMQINFKHTKTDVTGSQKRAKRNLYPNVKEAEIDFTFLLGLYLATCFTTSSRQEAGFRLFPGSSEGTAKRVSRKLKEVLELHREEVIAMGYSCINDIGLHSLRKGAASYLGSLPAGPSPVAICHRCGWSTGKVLDIYFRQLQRGDEFVGRCLSLLNLMSSDFALSPAYFCADEVSNEWLSNCLERVFPCFFHLGSLQRILQQCLASMIHHREYVAQLEPNHPARTSIAIFRDHSSMAPGIAALKIDKAWDTTNHISGVPPHVKELVELSDIKEQLGTIVERTFEKVMAGTEKYFEDRRIGGGEITEARLMGLIRDASEATRTEISDRLANQLERLTQSFQLSQHGQLDDEPEERGVSPTSELPHDFEFPSSHTLDLWTQWNVPNRERNIPALKNVSAQSYKFLNGGHRSVGERNRLRRLQSTRSEKERRATRKTASEMKTICRFIENEAERLGFVNITEENMLDAFKRVTLELETSGARRNRRFEQLSWKSNLLFVRSLKKARENAAAADSANPGNALDIASESVGTASSINSASTNRPRSGRRRRRTWRSGTSGGEESATDGITVRRPRRRQRTGRAARRTGQDDGGSNSFANAFPGAFDGLTAAQMRDIQYVDETEVERIRRAEQQAADEEMLANNRMVIRRPRGEVTQNHGQSSLVERQQYARALESLIETNRVQAQPAERRMGRNGRFIGLCSVSGCSVAIWVESIPGSTENWYFILPYVSFRGSCGVAIKLFHGCTISWDATVLYHCSTFSNNVQGGHAYGCMFGSCVGKSNTNA